MLLELLFGAAALSVIGALSDSDGSNVLDKGMNSTSEPMAKRLRTMYKNGQLSFAEYADKVSRLIPRIAAEHMQKSGMSQDDPSYGESLEAETERLYIEYNLDG